MLSINSEFITSIFLLYTVNCNLDTNSTYKYTSEIIFGLSKCKYEDCAGLIIMLTPSEPEALPIAVATLELIFTVT